MSLHCEIPVKFLPLPSIDLLGGYLVTAVADMTSLVKEAREMTAEQRLALIEALLRPASAAESRRPVEVRNGRERPNLARVDCGIRDLRQKIEDLRAKRRKSKSKSRRCYHCGDYGHYSTDCWRRNGSDTEMDSDTENGGGKGKLPSFVVHNTVDT